MIQTKHIFLFLLTIFLLWYFTSRTCIDTFSIGGQSNKFTNDSLRYAVNLWMTDKDSAIKKFGKINTWDTSEVTDMSYMFHGAELFDDDISGWDTSNASNMSSMFFGANSFNRDIGDWNTSKVENMSSMFYGANSFKQDIGKWDTSNVSDMSGMFYSNELFNIDISGWNTSNVSDMSNMFAKANSFNRDIGKWDTTNVSDMSSMFYGANSFNQDIGNWNTSNVKNMSNMFAKANSFKQDIGKWDTTNVSDMSGMFYSNELFNIDISGWDTSNVSYMSGMFADTKIFNRDIGNWKIGNVTYMDRMFYNASAFNQNLNCWKVDPSKVYIRDMFTGSKIGIAKYDPISTGCWKNVINGSNCNKCYYKYNKYICDGNTGKCFNSPYGSFNSLEQCKNNCLNKIQFNDKYCNNDTAYKSCKYLQRPNDGMCNEHKLTDRNNNDIQDYTSNNYCISKKIPTGDNDHICVPKCNPDINGCNRNWLHAAWGNACNHADNKKECGYDSELTSGENTLCNWNNIGNNCLPTTNICG